MRVKYICGRFSVDQKEDDAAIDYLALGTEGIDPHDGAVCEECYPKLAAELGPRGIAELVVLEVQKALDSGTRHYDLRGRLLPTAVDVIRALRQDGQVQFVPPEDDGPPRGAA